MRRVPVIIVICVLLVGLVALSEAVPERPPVTFGRAAQASMPSAAPPGALSSTWYCPGGTATGDGEAEATIVIANGRESSIDVLITVIPSEGEEVRLAISVPAESRADLELADVVDSPYASALLEFNGGGVAVEREVRGPAGYDASPCASAPSDTWYLAAGSTTRDAAQTLLLFNPFPGDAIVDLAFATPDGARTPRGLQALVVPGRSVVPIDLSDEAGELDVDPGDDAADGSVGAGLDSAGGDEGEDPTAPSGLAVSQQAVRRQPDLAMSLVARIGQVVVDRVQSYDGSEGRVGLSATLAAPDTSENWYFPEGLADENFNERIHVYNPTDDLASVDIQLVFEEQESEFVELNIPPQSFAVVDSATDDRLIRGVPHSTRLESVNGVGVVVEREFVVDLPSGRRGLAMTVGATEVGDRWLIAAGEASRSQEEWVIVFNPSGELLAFTIEGLADGRRITRAELTGVDLPAGARVAVELSGVLARSDTPLIVEATGDVVVERGIYRNGAQGISTAMAVPLRD